MDRLEGRQKTDSRAERQKIDSQAEIEKTERWVERQKTDSWGGETDVRQAGRKTEEVGRWPSARIKHQDK